MLSGYGNNINNEEKELQLKCEWSIRDQELLNKAEHLTFELKSMP